MSVMLTPRRVHRGILLVHLWLWFCPAATHGSVLTCTDYTGMEIEEGSEYTPSADDMCYRCYCDVGYPVRCTNTACSPPKCEMYEVIQGECCRFNCLEAADSPPKSAGNDTGLGSPLPGELNSANLPLRLVASTVTSFLILALLLFMIHRLRQRRTLIMLRRLNSEQQVDDPDGYLPHMDNVDFGIEFPPYEDPPPPYSPPKPPTIPEGEAPPPYEGNTTLDDGSLPDTDCDTSHGNGNIPVSGAVITNMDAIRNGAVPMRNGHAGFRNSARRESGCSRGRRSTGSLCTRSTNTETESTLRASEAASTDTADASYGLSVAVAALNTNGPLEANRQHPQVVLRLEKQNPTARITESQQGSSEQQDAATRRAPQKLLSQFIKRSDSIEIRRGSSSPRNSFYFGGNTSEDSTSSSDTPEPVMNMASLTRVTGSLHQPYISSEYRNSSQPVGSEETSYPLGWDPSTHDPSPTSDSSSSSDSNTDTLPINHGHRLKPAFKTAGPALQRKSDPPNSLQLPLYSSHYQNSDKEHNQTSNIRISTNQGPRPSYQNLPNEPSTSNTLEYVAGGSTRAHETVPKELPIRPPTQSASNSRVNSPLSPALRPVNRSGSVTSQVSMFSVCSETGERKRPVLSLPPEALLNDDQYPLSPLSPVSSMISAPQPEVTMPLTESPEFSAPTLPNNVMNSLSNPPHEETAETTRLHHRDISPAAPKCDTTTAQHNIVRTRPKIVYREPDEITTPPLNISSTASAEKSEEVTPVHVGSGSASNCPPIQSSSPKLEPESGGGHRGKQQKRRRPQSNPVMNGGLRDNGRSYVAVGASPERPHRNALVNGSPRDDNGKSYVAVGASPEKPHRNAVMNGGPRDGNGRSYAAVGASPERPHRHANGGSRDDNGRSYNAVAYSPERPHRHANGASRDDNGRSDVAMGASPERPHRHANGGPRDDNGRSDVAVGSSPERPHRHANGASRDDNGRSFATVGASPERPHRNNGAANYSEQPVPVREPRIKQYGFIDRPELLSACKDNTVYPEAGDKVPNSALFEKLQQRSLSRDRQQQQDRQNSSGYSSKSTCNDRSGGSSGERSRSASRSRSRSRDRVARRGNNCADNRRWSEPPNMNLVHNCQMAEVCEHKTRSPRRRKKKKVPTATLR